MAKRKKRNERQRNHSTIPQHQQIGKQLIPPMMQLSNMKLVSWANQRLPEYIWLALIVVLKDREDALDTIRKAITYLLRMPEEKRPRDLSLTELARIDPDFLDNFLSYLVNELDEREVLRPLIVFSEFPGAENWKKQLEISDASDSDWEKLSITVSRCLFHQSQESTDCRWARVCYYVLLGRLRLPTKELIDEILDYPHYGDMRKVRPSIRASEGALDMTVEDHSSPWPDQFWNQCMIETPCWYLYEQKKKEGINTEGIKEQINIIIDELILHSHQSRSTTAVDPKHDTIFGAAIYSLRLIEELIKNDLRTTITGRMIIRTLTEVYITLAYLSEKNEEQLWLTYRNYGAGQVKLAFLKLDEIESPPKFIEIETLSNLADEDVWKEYLNINLGHWENTNLRKMSDTAKIKDDYDKYYNWTSGFVHGHWGAIRNSVYETCGNPLHRLHRILKDNSNDLGDVTNDAIILCNKISEIVNKEYPEFKPRIEI